VTEAPRLADLLPAARTALGRIGLGGILPILTFYLLYRVGGPMLGILGGMTVSLLALAIQARRIGRLDPIVLLPMAVILIQGSAAIALDSVELYLAAPAVENILWGIALTGSVLLRRPLVRVIARELDLIPAGYADSATVGHALRHVTLAWGLAAFVKAAIRLWLLFSLPLEAFLVVHTVVNFTINGATTAFSFWWPLRATRREHT
jgi:hypothetical protein